MLESLIVGAHEELVSLLFKSFITASHSTSQSDPHFSRLELLDTHDFLHALKQVKLIDRLSEFLRSNLCHAKHVLDVEQQQLRTGFHDSDSFLHVFNDFRHFSQFLSRQPAGDSCENCKELKAEAGENEALCHD